MAWQRFRAQTSARQALVAVGAAFAALVLTSGIAGAIGGGAAGSDEGDPVPLVGTSTSSPTPSPSPTPVVETRTEAATESVAYTSSTVDDPNLKSGTTAVSVAGVPGTLTRTFEVTYTDGVETSRVEVSAVVTTPAVNEVIARGTKVDKPPPPPPPAPTGCPNGTYENSAGNTVCRPYESDAPPAGATAQCKDGTWSFSQSRSGTCSGHGGVSRWL
ncbi:G5 domain-containing protein [Aeromicrobium alkaliterrae]|uniref:G5 domain-containing protein n=1 Tax=Aeromicrobium alkaliterrae TaxID=302168 RepID=A0ABP4VSE9_9ACTN